MTKFNPTKSIVAAIAAGALAFAAPAGASVLEPVTAGWNTDDSSYVGSVTAVSQQTSESQPAGDLSSLTALSHPTGETQPTGDLSSLTALSHPTGESQPAGDLSTVTALSHPTGGNQPTALASNPVDPGTVADFPPTSAASRALASSSTSPVAGDNDGFNIGYAAIGAGAALLLASIAMYRFGGRRDSGSRPGTAVPRAA